MKNALIVACALLFVSVAGSAQTSSKAQLTTGALAWFLGQPEVTGCATQQSSLLLTAKPLSISSGSVEQLRSTAAEPVVLLSSWQDSKTGRACNSCCQCSQTGDCIQCCLCNGFSKAYCFGMCR
jgi:hypothetical protein